jgi:hypothetical protein
MSGAYMSELHSVVSVLELACAAQRINQDYIKETTPVYSDDMKIMSYKWANKMLMMTSLYPENYRSTHEGDTPPPLLKVTDDDKNLTEEIKKYYRKLMFSAVKGDNDFHTEVNALLENGQVPPNKFGFIACLPMVYKRDLSKKQFEKRIKEIEDLYIGMPGEIIVDKDCEILESIRSKHYDAFNILAIIDNKMVSWMGKADLKLGPCIVQKAKIKEHSRHWKNQNKVTRLNYVKTFQ